GVPQAEGELDRVGDEGDMEGEQRPGGVILIKAIINAAEVTESAKTFEGGEDAGARRAAHGRNRSGTDAGDGAQRAVGRIEARKTAARNDTAGSKTAILRAEANIIAHRQLLVGVEAADEPVELAVEGLAVQPHFLSESVELAIGVRIVGTIENIDRAVIEVAGLA